jgi:hypothetical protein
MAIAASAMGAVGAQNERKGPVLVSLMIGTPLGNGADYYIEKGTLFAGVVVVGEENGSWSTTFTITKPLIGQPGNKVIFPVGTKVVSSPYGVLIKKPNGTSISCRSFFSIRTSINPDPACETELVVTEGGLITGAFVDGEPATSVANTPGVLTAVNPSKGRKRSVLYQMGNSEAMSIRLLEVEDPTDAKQKVKVVQMAKDFVGTRQAGVIFPKGTMIYFRGNFLEIVFPDGGRCLSKPFLAIDGTGRVRIVQGSAISYEIDE